MDLICETHGYTKREKSYPSQHISAWEATWTESLLDCDELPIPIAPQPAKDIVLALPYILSHTFTHSQHIHAHRHKHTESSVFSLYEAKIKLTERLLYTSFLGCLCSDRSKGQY